MAWTTPADIRAEMERYWTSGRLLGAEARREALFPLTLRFRKPAPKDLGERFEDVRNWIRQLDEASKSRRGFGYEIEWTPVNHRQLGRNRLPTRVVIPTAQDAFTIIGRSGQAELFRRLTERSLQTFPELQGWMASRPLAVIENAADWERVLCVLAWLRDHPRSGRYIRQIDLPGVDTKFIETRTALLAELHAAISIGESRDEKPVGFEQRFGLISKPLPIRFRLLDENLYVNGFSDLAVPAADFARFAPPAERIFITENEINGLAFPKAHLSLVIFGLGYGLERLGEAAWLRDREVYYWGDIDTHGFAMLDRLRAALPQARSFLMDRRTLTLHRNFWVSEPEQYRKPLRRLTGEEQSLYGDLVENRFGERVRLEQERISFGTVEEAVFRTCQ